MYLRGKTVLVVPDADWFQNWQVERQALKVRTLLRSLGVASHIAAPPYDATGGDYHKGVDDFLGAGHTLEELVIEGREFPPDMIEQAVAHVHGRGRPRAAHALRVLCILADRDGILCPSFQMLRAEFETKNAERVLSMLDSLKGTYTITSGSLDTEQFRHPHRKGQTLTEFTNRPTIHMDPNFIEWRKRAILSTKDFYDRDEVAAVRGKIRNLKAELAELEGHVEDLVG
jgi:hypothetical protein